MWQEKLDVWKLRSGGRRSQETKCRGRTGNGQTTEEKLIYIYTRSSREALAFCMNRKN